MHVQIHIQNPIFSVIILYPFDNIQLYFFGLFAQAYTKEEGPSDNSFVASKSGLGKKSNWCRISVMY